MLRNKEPELAEKIDSSFGCFDLGFYRVNFVFGSRHLIIVPKPVVISKATARLSPTIANCCSPNTIVVVPNCCSLSKNTKFDKCQQNTL